MLCLSCGHDEAGLGPACGECGSYIGYPTEGRGYLPQLKALDTGLQEGSITAEDSQQRLARMADALEMMIKTMDECGHGLVNLEWDSVQQGTLGGFLAPIREGLERLLNLTEGLDPAGDWDEETWAALEEAQLQVYRGNEGVNLLTEVLAGYAVEQGVDLNALCSTALADSAGDAE